MRTTSSAAFATISSLILAACVAAFMPGCARIGRRTAARGPQPRLQVYRVSDVAQAGSAEAAAVPSPAGPARASISGARNEWVSFAVELTDMPTGAWHSLRVRGFRRPSDGGKAPALPVEVEAYQIVSMPVDVNRAGYVRHTGSTTAVTDLPRALLPLPMSRDAIDLRALREPLHGKDDAGKRDASNAAASAPRVASAPSAKGKPMPAPPAAPTAARVWIDLRIPTDAPAGEYAASLDLMQATFKQPVASLPVSLTVYDFALPAERHLQLVGRLSWDALKRLYPDRFESVTPRLLNRRDARYQPAVSALDDLVALAQRHRAGLVVSRLQPTVKWPADRVPEIDWAEYDNLTAPWLSGGAFADRVAPGFWPLPAPDFLLQYDRASQLAYWGEAARHFDQNDWLARSPVWIDNFASGRSRLVDAIQLSQRAGQVLRLHNGIRVGLPLEDDQVQITGRDGPEMIEAASADRLWAAAPGLVYLPPTQEWPEGVAQPSYWLRTDMPGLVPYAGAGGDERDVRLWAWLAFLRHATLITWGEALPSLDAPTAPADPDETVWFYPGHWFGLERPVPTVQLKWLRRAEQDYEYLHLARERGEVLNALLLARLITKPVKIFPGQAADPAYGLMCGTTDVAAWDQAQNLLARTIVIRPSGAPGPSDPERHALNIDTLRWIEPQDRAVVMGHAVRWLWDDVGQSGGRKPNSGPRVLNLRLGVDIYNASDSTPDRNLLRWSAPSPGWEVRPQPVEVSTLVPYNVRRETLEARFDLARLTPEARQPVEVTFTSGFNSERRSTVRLVLPVATSEHAEGRRLAVDGKLDEWQEADLIQDGPMVQMLSRPALQKQELRVASTPAKVYTGWAEDGLYVAFSLKGITPENLLKGSQNFVDYKFRRAWGEDLCTVLVQPVYDDNRLGPVLNLTFKPTGTSWVERKLDPKLNADPWQPLEGSRIRYKAALDGSDWRGEVSIPWNAIVEPGAAVPTLLRFNFSQHRTATGESASWAGPVDFGRDDGFTGVLYLKETRAPGIIGDAGGPRQ